MANTTKKIVKKVIGGNAKPPRKSSASKTKKTTNAEAKAAINKRNAARLMVGAGDASMAPAGQVGNRNMRSGGSGKLEESGNTTKGVTALGRKKSAMDSFNWSNKLTPGSDMAMMDKYTKLTPSAKKIIKEKMSNGTSTPFDNIADRIQPPKRKPSTSSGGSSSVTADPFTKAEKKAALKKARLKKEKADKKKKDKKKKDKKKK